MSVHSSSSPSRPTLQPFVQRNRVRTVAGPTLLRTNDDVVGLVGLELEGTQNPGREIFLFAFGLPASCALSGPNFERRQLTTDALSSRLAATKHSANH